MITNPEKQELLRIFQEANQTEIVKTIENVEDGDKIDNLYKQVKGIESNYKGGICEYVRRAQMLLKNTNPPVNKITTPLHNTRIYLNTNYEEYESMGKELLSKTGFVLVAGGLGERLGSKDIKISLICELITNKTFMDYYLDYFKEIFKMTGKKVQLFIMTSEDTHKKTIDFLQKRQFSKYLNIHMEKQDKVPCLKNFESDLDFDENEFLLNLKPHGHGDVHQLIKRTHTLKKWTNLGLEYIYFFQDTNPFSLPSLPAVLGSTLKNNFDMNFLTCQRKPGEAMGTIVSDEQGRTFNIEYNIFSDVLRKIGKEDELDEKGYSLYPGNTNCFVIKIKAFKEIIGTLEENLKEFVNPKTDKKTGKLVSSFRLECLMQDIALIFGKDHKIGTTQLEKQMCITTAKNNLESGIQNQIKKIPSETIIELENDIYYRNFLILQKCGVSFGHFHSNNVIDHSHKFKKTRVLSNIKLINVPRIVLAPSFGILIEDIRKRFKNVELDITHELTLVIIGKVFFENCKFSRVSLWFENKGPHQLSITYMKICNIDDNNMIRLVHHENEDELDNLEYSEILRGYKIVDREKIIKICSK